MLQPRLLLRLLIALAMMPGAVRGADDPAANAAEVALQRALDQPITLTLPTTELHEAFNRIAAEAKIPLQVDPACYDLLPYGRTTRIEFEARQSKLRETLEDLLVPLGLQQTVTGKSILIRPSAPLFHIGHRATWEELKLLQDLHTAQDLKPTPAPPAGSSAPAFDLTTALRAALDGRKDLIVSFAAGTMDESSAAALDQIRKQLPMNPYRALERYTQDTGQVWFVEAGPLAGGPTGGTIRIMTRRQWIERQLDRPIQISATNESLEKIVADLSHASGIRIVPEPGLYLAVPRIGFLSSNNDTLRQTLTALSGAAGVEVDMREDSILLRLKPVPGTAGSERPASSSDDIVGRIALPIGKEGLTMDLLLRESDLPRELNDRRKKAIREYVEALQKTWSAPPAPVPPTPAAPPTAPATAPAAVAVPAATAPATRPATAPATQPQR